MNKNIIIVILVAIVALGGGFFGGMQYQKMQRPSNTFFARGDNLAARGGGVRFGGQNGTRPVLGQIISSDANSITVKEADGSTKIVIVGSSATINKATTGTKDDLKTGETVAVIGTQNSDGSVTAQNIQLNPQMRFGAGIKGTGSPTPTK